MIHGVSAEVFQAAFSAALNAPDPRTDRVKNAVEHLGKDRVDAHDVAQAILASAEADAAH